MAFDDEILGPEYTNLDQFIPYNYAELYKRVVASEPRAALELEFLTDGRTDVDNDYKGDAEKEVEKDDNETGVDGEEGDDEEFDDEDDFYNTNDDYDDEQNHDLDPEESDNVDDTYRSEKEQILSKSCEEETEEAYSEDKMDIDVKEFTQLTTTTVVDNKGKKISQSSFDQTSTTQDKSVIDGISSGLELYFATYIWTLIYFREYHEACTVAERYRDSVIFAISPVLRASVKSALRFYRKTTNDTIDFQAIYRIAGMFPWEDASKGGSFGLAQLVKDALSVFQKEIYSTLRDQFTRIRVDTIAKYLPISEEHETICASDVLRVLNSVEEGWTQEGETILIPPKKAIDLTTSSQTSRVDGETRKRWLNELVKVASELEQKSLVG